ncbi:MAG: Hpt domain-containing protein [Opitutales bacterium]
MSHICAPTMVGYLPDESLTSVDAEQVELLNCAAEGMEAEFWEDMLTTFAQEVEPRFALIEQACTSEDAPNLRKYVHFIAGSAANLGLQRLSSFCRNVENALDDGIFTAYADCAPTLRHEYDDALNALRGQLAALS